MTYKLRVLPCPTNSDPALSIHVPWIQIMHWTFMSHDYRDRTIMSFGIGYSCLTNLEPMIIGVHCIPWVQILHWIFMSHKFSSFILYSWPTHADHHDLRIKSTSLSREFTSCIEHSCSMNSDHVLNIHVPRLQRSNNFVLRYWTFMSHEFRFSIEH